jgi:hypothetical protein
MSTSIHEATLTVIRGQIQPGDVENPSQSRNATATITNTANQSSPG